MSSSTIKYSLYGIVQRIDKPHSREHRGMRILTLHSPGEYTTQVMVSEKFVNTHKLEVGQVLLKQLDGSTIVVTQEEFAKAVFVRQEVRPMDESEITNELHNNARRYLDRKVNHV